MAWTEKRWNLLGWLAFSSLLFFNLYHHAMWVDELQAWSLTRASGDPYELFINLYPEGHPMLWYLLLWFPGRWTANPLGMQGVNFVLAVMSIGLIWLRSPLDWKEKLLLSLSYQVGYNFFVLSRCYSLGTLLVLVFVSFPSVFRQRSYLAWAVLGLLANVHLYFTAASLCLAIVWMGSQANSKRLLGGASAYLVGFFFAALALLRAMNPDETRFTHLPFVILLTFALGLGLWLFASDLAKATKVATWGTGAILVVSATILVVGNVASRGFKVNRLGRDLSVLGAGFLPLRNPFQPLYWELVLPPAIGVLTFLISVFCLFALFRKQPLVVICLTFQFGLALLVFHFRQGGLYSHVGVIFISFIGYLWLCRNSGLRVGPKWLVLIFLVPQAIAGIQATVYSKSVPLSGSRAAASWLRESSLNVETIFAYKPFPTLGVATYLEQPLYFPEADSKLAHFPWGHWLKNEYVPAVLAKRMKREGISTAYLIVPLGMKKRIEKALKETPTLEWELSVDLRGAVIENYSVFHLQLVPREPVQPEPVRPSPGLPLQESKALPP